MFVSSPKHAVRMWGSVNPLLNGYRAGKRSERESNHLTQSNAEINIAMSYTYAFMARTGTNVPVELVGKRLVPKESLYRNTQPTLKVRVKCLSIQHNYAV